MKKTPTSRSATAAFFVKGKGSFDDISGSGWKATLAALLLVAGGLAQLAAGRGDLPT